MAFSDRELALENEMTDRGVERRRASSSRIRAKGKESLTGPGHRLVRAAMGRTVTGLEAWLKTEAKRSPTNRSAAYALAKQVPPRIMALLGLRAALDGACANRTWQAVVHAIATRVDEERAARWLERTHRGLWHAARRRSKSIPERAASRLREDVRRLMKEQGFQRWSMSDRLKVGALVLEIIDQCAGLIRIDRVRKARRRALLLVTVLPEVADWIQSATKADECLEPLYLPMLDRPGEWGKGLLGGYATPLVARKHLVKNRSRVTQGLVAEADMPAVYGAVNALQGTAWEVNPDLLEVARALMSSGQSCPGLESADPEPYPEVPPEGKTKDWLRARFVVRRSNIHRASRRVESARVLWLAGRLRDEGEFYFPQQLDFRGRTYPVPQFLQPQGPDLARGLLRFAKGDWIASPGPEAFWVHGANCYGDDKLSLADRTRRMAERHRDIGLVYRDPLEHRWWQEAADPWQFLAWCLEAGQLLETGRVRTKVPCYIDGTNNGLQILSLLLRDEVGGVATNCVPGPRRDIYQDVADEVTRGLRERDDETARGWLAWFPDGRMPRACAKRPVMTLPYGCTSWSVRQYVSDWFEEELRLGRPNPWGTASWSARANDLASALWAAIGRVLGRALECLAWLRELARISVESGVSPTWTSPSGFPVRQSYTNWEVLQVRTKFGERVRWVRTRKAGDRLNVRRHVNALAPNFVHSLDAAVLARVVAGFSPDGQVPVSTIHDSFGTTAPRMDELGRRVREVYAATFADDLLANLRDQLVANAGGRVYFPEAPERGALDPSAVIGSQYLFS